METNVGYVLVSRTVNYIYRRCVNCESQPGGHCPTPTRSGVVVCVPARNAPLSQDSLSQEEFKRRSDQHFEAHFTEECTGGTRLGPLHYFSDCSTLLKRGPRRADARIVSLNAETARALGLPLCKQCKAKMAPFEEQLPAAEPCTESCV